MNTVFSLKATGLVIEARMDNTAIVACLMLGYTIFFFQHQYAGLVISADQLEAGGQAYNATSNNDDVVLQSRKICGEANNLIGKLCGAVKNPIIKHQITMSYFTFWMLVFGFGILSPVSDLYRSYSHVE